MCSAKNKDRWPEETDEWLQALADVVEAEGPERAQFLLEQLLQQAALHQASPSNQIHTPYLNTITPEAQAAYPGNLALEEQIVNRVRWNAMATVIRGGKRAAELGGHIASYASAAWLYEVGFQHFFKARSDNSGGDLLYIQGHSSPGIYARSFLEGRFSEQQMDHFREEVEVDGLASYPHPWLMPDYWQFPTVSMGLGPIQGIYQARFLKYLHHRGLADTSNRTVWVFCGDGEMDEPESLGALSIAAREKLDNLIFVINCNLQRLDGPVRGNSKVVQELEGIFRGSGWHAIKVLWDSHWDELLANDSSGKLKQLMAETIDGDYQNFKAKPGSYGREHFFGKYPETQALVEHLSDEEIENLHFGGHDPLKVFNAYQQAVNHQDQPVVILAKTTKGFGMGSIGQGQNTTHQQKKLNEEQIRAFRDRFDIPVSDKDVAKVPYSRFAEDSDEYRYLQERRQQLGGALPARHKDAPRLTVPSLEALAKHCESTGEREISTTMAFVRLLGTLLRDKNIKEHIVPVIPDECRTFGMEGLFRQLGIYSPNGQQYQPVDADQLMYYREAENGQVLEEGLNEAGGFCSWLAAATSYSTNQTPMIPFYIYYSMFGFQRIGDLAWAAGDMRARGFLLGATAGRTTLAGEGLQHQDGQSLVLASLIPNCRVYDPTYSYELTVIIQEGLKRMVEDQVDEFYYLTVMNENYSHPAMPKGAEEGIIKGMYCLRGAKTKHKASIQLLGSGTILREVLAAAECLEQDYQINASVWSVTSFTELAREARASARQNRLHPQKKAKPSYVASCLANQPGPVLAATDYVAQYSEQIRFAFDKPYVTLGTDGFGRSDTRKQLRHYFEVDCKMIVYTALCQLAESGEFSAKKLSAAMKDLGINADKADPLHG